MDCEGRSIKCSRIAGTEASGGRASCRTARIARQWRSTGRGFSLTAARRCEAQCSTQEILSTRDESENQGCNARHCRGTANA